MFPILFYNISIRIKEFVSRQALVCLLMWLIIIRSTRRWSRGQRSRMLAYGRRWHTGRCIFTLISIFRKGLSSKRIFSCDIIFTNRCTGFIAWRRAILTNRRVWVWTQVCIITILFPVRLRPWLYRPGVVWGLPTSIMMPLSSLIKGFSLRTSTMTRFPVFKE